MKINKKLAYGTKEDTPKELLYVKRIILRNYREPEKVKTFMDIMSNFKIFQFNYDKAVDSDYFMWQYVNDKGEKDWKHVELSCYDDSMDGAFKMHELLEICESTYTDIDVEVQLEDIRILVNKIESEEE